MVPLKTVTAKASQWKRRMAKQGAAQDGKGAEAKQIRAL